MLTGKSGWLKCDWRIENDNFYSVKWYLGSDEFYRWSPKADPPLLTFNVSAFEVDPHRSKKGHVFIKNITMKANGVVRCEVSGEAPYFETDYKDAALKVYGQI